MDRESNPGLRGENFAPFLTFRNSSSNEISSLQIVNGSCGHLYLSTVPSFEMWTCQTQGKNVTVRNNVFTNQTGVSPCSLSHFRPNTSFQATCWVPRDLLPCTFKLPLLCQRPLVTQNCDCLCQT
jgi:hypothetical protein